MTTAYNEIAQRFVESFGFSCEPEPSWVPGRKPDFFCSGPLDFWLEVKSLPPRDEDEHLARIHDYLRKRSSKIHARGSGHAFVSGDATEHDAKQLLRLVEWTTKHEQAAKVTSAVVVVPYRPLFSGRTNFVYSTDSGDVLFSSYKSETADYGLPFVVEPSSYRQKVAVSCDDGTRAEVTLYELVETEDYRISMWLSLNASPFQLTATGPSGGATELRTKQRIRSAIRDANNQLKSGHKQRPAPAVVFIYENGPLVADDRIVLSALFGDLQYVANAKAWDKGELRYGDDGAWRGQNSTTSALVYFRNKAVPLVIHNPWADQRLQAGLFRGREYVAEPNGTLRLVEHP